MEQRGNALLWTSALQGRSSSVDVQLGILSISPSILGPLATMLVGISIAFIAWQQWQVARAKLRLDLFDRRYKIYDSTRKFVALTMRDANFSDSQLFEFFAGTSDAAFLFDADVFDYLKQIGKRAVDMRIHHHACQNVPMSDERSRHVQETHNQLLWLSEQLTAMTKIFTPYLGFSNIKGNLF